MMGPEGGEMRLLRGGSYRSPSITGRTTTRAMAIALTREVDVGFRCAADAPSFTDVRIERYRSEP